MVYTLREIKGYGMITNQNKITKSKPLVEKLRTEMTVSGLHGVLSTPVSVRGFNRGRL